MKGSGKGKALTIMTVSQRRFIVISSDIANTYDQNNGRAVIT